MVLGCASDVLKFGSKVFQELYSRLQALQENDDFRQRIERKIKELKTVAKELQDSEVEDFPASCTDCLEKYQNSLGTCQLICETLFDKSKVGKFLYVYTDSQQLYALESELESARNSLQLALTRAILAQNDHLKRLVKEGNARVEATVLHPSAGVYYGTCVSNKMSKPFTIDKPEVLIKGDLMTVKWTDRKNPVTEIDRYEVRYDDEKDSVVPGIPEKITTARFEYAMSLGHPKVLPGKLYTIQVRAANGQGAGEWSAETVARFKTGPPNKPGKLRVTVMSPTEVRLEVPRLKEDEENGSPVRECLVEYTFKEDKNATERKRLYCPIKPRHESQGQLNVLKLSIKSLTPNSTYSFCVRMINEAGESQPSYAGEVSTTQLTPGTPQDLRVSSKRTDKTIKIRWKAPEVNPHVVIKYEVQRQLAKARSPPPWVPVETAKPEKLSSTARDLATNTKYRFRVRALNNKGESGDFSDVIEAETRCGQGAKIAAATAAALGGTIGGPLIGAIGIGTLAGSSAEDSADSNPGKVAAGAAAGIGGGIGGLLLGTIGAPVVGVLTGVATFKGMSGELGELSPQSSDDEEGENDKQEEK